MKSLHVLGALVLAATAIAPVTFPAAAAAETTVLTFNRWTPATHHFHARIMKPWADRVEQATEGRVKITFTAASLGTPARQYDLARTGVVDIASANQSYTAERFPLAMFAELPNLGASAEALSVANWRATAALQKQTDEYKGTKLLAVFTNGPAMIFTRKAPVASLSDLANLRIRVSEGIPAQVTEQLGAIPVAAPITEAYQMLSKGIIDSIVLPPDSIHSFKLDRYLKYMTHTSASLFASNFFVVMNEAKWNSLSEQDQQAIMSVSGENFAREAGKVWDEQDEMALKEFTQSGMHITQASAEFSKTVDETLAGLEAKWLAVAESKGVDGRKLLSSLREDIEAFEAAQSASEKQR